MPDEEKKVVDIDTSGPETEINVPEEKDKISAFLRNFPYKLPHDEEENQRLNHIINQ